MKRLDHSRGYALFFTRLLSSGGAIVATDVVFILL